MMKNMAYGILLSTLVFALLGMGFGAQDESDIQYKKLLPAEVKEIMESGDPYGLLDVRTDEEFLERHIQGAFLIPYSEIKKRAALDLPNKDGLILIYCRSGRRSAIAAKDLIQLGYTRVYDFGGINDWPYAIVDGGSAKR